MKFHLKIIVFASLFLFVEAASFIATEFDGVEKQKIDMIAEIILNNLKNNGWNNIFVVGQLPDLLYHRLKVLPFTFAVIDVEKDDVIQMEDVVPYHSNIIIINCHNFQEFEAAILKIINFAYWDALANIILYYHAPYDKNVVAKLFYIFWFYRAINVIIVQDHNTEVMLISRFSPYISEGYTLENSFGCWKAKKIGMPILNFNDGFVCVNGCHNVSTHSKLREKNLGTCIGFSTEIINIDNKSLINLNLFEDKGKNLHGFPLLTYAVQVLPFFGISEHADGTFTFHYRDGMIWNTMAKLFNFTIDIFPSLATIRGKFDFEINVKQVFTFSQRKADLILFPLYQFDLVIAEVDYTVPYLDSGVCFLSHKAEFQTIVFDERLVQRNMFIIIEFFICFICTWFVFFIFNTVELTRLSLDQAGKDLINTFRTVLSISLYNPPKRESFRIFLTISIWSFFVINFSSQAAIISLFSIHKRGKEVDTFNDIIEKGYKIEGIASPDAVLPDNEETFRIITSRMVTIHDMFECVYRLSNDSRRFCLIDCALGRYFVKNLLNAKGKQFLHIATDARIHSHYLHMILHKDSPLTEHYNKYIMALFEAGLIMKWMDYRYVDMKEEIPLKPLGMEDLGGIFQLFACLLAVTFTVFVLEVLFSFILWWVGFCKKKLNLRVGISKRNKFKNNF